MNKVQKTAFTDYKGRGITMRLAMVIIIYATENVVDMHTRNTNIAGRKCYN
jgi:hypothetical protein